MQKRKFTLVLFEKKVSDMSKRENVPAKEAISAQKL